MPCSQDLEGGLVITLKGDYLVYQVGHQVPQQSIFLMLIGETGLTKARALGVGRTGSILQLTTHRDTRPNHCIYVASSMHPDYRVTISRLLHRFIHYGNLSLQRY